MKRVATLFFALLLIFATGCGRVSMQPPAHQTPDAQPEATSSQASPSTPTLIGEDKAKEIALKHAGIIEDGVRFNRIELDRDDGILVYEVEFFQDRTEYDAEINAEDGTVLSFEKDYQD